METFGQGNVAFFTNTQRILLAKILNAIAGGGGGGGGLSGSGSPQGAQVASPGQTYWDTAGQSLWVKNTGVGNTGWVQLIG